MADQYRIYFIARFLARGALIGARRCSSAKRRAAFTSLADSDPGHREARATRVGKHNKLLRGQAHFRELLYQLLGAQRRQDSRSLWQVGLLACATRP